MVFLLSIGVVFTHQRSFAKALTRARNFIRPMPRRSKRAASRCPSAQLIADVLTSTETDSQLNL